MRLDRESASQSKFPSRTRVRAPWAIAMMAALAFGLAVAAPEGNAVGERIATQVDAGDFKGAEAAIAQGLADKATTPEQRTALAFERERMRRIGLDAGMNALMRPALYAAWHEIVNLSRLDEADGVPAEIVGPICESSDVLGKRRPLPDATAEGDVALVATAGAYGFVMANRYNLRALPVEEIIE